MNTPPPGDNAAHTHTRHPSTMTTMAAAPPAARSSTANARDVATSLTADPARSKKTLKHQSWEYAIRSGIAGGIAGCAAKTVVGPLDRVKILFQASNPQFQKYTGSWLGAVRAVRDIWGADGMRGLFRGHSATLLRIFPYAGIKFLAYEQVRAVVIRDSSQETAVRRFASGSIAGMVSVFFTYPLEVVRVRMAWETRVDARGGGYLAICRRIYNERPTTPAAATPPPPGQAVAQAAMQRGAATAGLGNFFRGFTPTMWGMLPYAGSSFLAHDSAGDFMRQPRLAGYTTLPDTAGKSLDPGKPAQLRYWAELATGGFAGFVSQTVSYPLEVIRRRMQVGGVVGDGHRLGMAEVARDIYRAGGWRGFYVGLSIGYVKVIPMVSVSFYAYERAKYWLGI